MHIFTKMEYKTKQDTDLPHPHEEIVNFIEKYEEIIKPNLKKGNLDDIKGLIAEVCIRFGYYEDSENRTDSKRGTYERYRMAVTLLSPLYQMQEVGPRLLESITIHTNRLVSELGLILSDDPRFIKMRERNPK